jgi:hypothetical protein
LVIVGTLDVDGEADEEEARMDLFLPVVALEHAQEELSDAEDV